MYLLLLLFTPTFKDLTKVLFVLLAFLFIILSRLFAGSFSRLEEYPNDIFLKKFWYSIRNLFKKSRNKY